MFERSGEKIKNVGKVIFYIMFAIAIIVLFLGLFGAAINPRYVGGAAIISSIISAAVILLSAWLWSLFLTAFGDLVESNQKIVELLQQIINGEYRRISPSEKYNDAETEIK